MKRCSLSSAMIVLLAATCANAQTTTEVDDPLIRRTVIFAAPPTGYAMVRTPTLSPLPDGTIVLECAAKRGKGDWAPSDVFRMRSTDGGKTWSEPSVLFTNPNSTVDAYTITARDGTVHLLVMRDYGSLEHVVSTDNGQTFSKPTDITPVLNEWAKQLNYKWTVVAPGPGSGIELANGRLVAPLWMSDNPERKHGPTQVATIYSDDKGATWHMGDIVAKDSPQTPNPNESDILQLPDGRVMINMRNGSPLRQRLISESPDGATGWSKPRYEPALFEPVCEASWTVVPLVNGKHLIVHVAPASDQTDPAKIPPAPKQAPRENLTLYASPDDGKTWPIKKQLDAGRSSYSDVCVGKDGRVLVVYESGVDPEKPNLTSGVTFLSIDPAWIVK